MAMNRTGGQSEHSSIKEGDVCSSYCCYRDMNPSRDDKAGNCSICSVEIIETDELQSLSCNHKFNRKFHKDCETLLRKFGASDICPVCRVSIYHCSSKQFDEARHLYVVLVRRMKQEGKSWVALSDSDNLEILLVAQHTTEAAHEGNPHAQYLLAELCSLGRGKLKNEFEAFEWYRQAAEQGLAAAQLDFGVRLANGIGASKNEVKAVKWFRTSAEQGYREAQFNLGCMLADGKGAAQNELEATMWFHKSAEQGCAAAQFNLGVRLGMGKGISKNEVEAVEWYRKAAKQGHSQAQFNLGLLLSSPKSSPQNEVEAVKWFRAAAEQGHSGAQINLGFSLNSGRGTVQDTTEAMKWYRQAADQGNSLAQSNLRICLIKQRMERIRMAAWQLFERPLGLCLLGGTHHEKKQV